MKIRFIILILALIFIGSMLILSIYDPNNIFKEGETMKESSKEESKVYQGPVPEGYDEEHFRKTGETRPLEKNN